MQSDFMRAINAGKCFSLSTWYNIKKLQRAYSVAGNIGVTCVAGQQTISTEQNPSSEGNISLAS